MFVTYVVLRPSTKDPSSTIVKTWVKHDEISDPLHSVIQPCPIYAPRSVLLTVPVGMVIVYAYGGR